MIKNAETVPSVTRRFELGVDDESLTVYVVVALRDSLPCGIFIYAGAEGSMNGGLFRMLGHMASWLLERGVPLSKLADLWGTQIFGPRSWESPERPGECGYQHMSVLDAIGRWLQRRFPQGEA
jgi:hypothetical protein